MRTSLFIYCMLAAAYTWRGAVALDRPYFYTDGKLTFSDSVSMPRVIDYSASSGYIKGGLVLSAAFTEQRTLGGDAIALVGGYSHVLDGRNVGRSTTLTAGVMYLFNVKTRRDGTK